MPRIQNLKKKIWFISDIISLKLAVINFWKYFWIKELFISRMQINGSLTECLLYLMSFLVCPALRCLYTVFGLLIDWSLASLMKHWLTKCASSAAKLVLFILFSVNQNVHVIKFNNNSITYLSKYFVSQTSKRNNS